MPHGPIARQGRRIAETIANREFTGIVAVATPEDVAANEGSWTGRYLKTLLERHAKRTKDRPRELQRA